MTTQEFLRGHVEHLTTDQLDYHAKTRTFVAEVSELENFSPSGISTILLSNPKTGKTEAFTFTSADTSEDDVYGWRYRNKAGDLEILIIND